MFPPKPCHRLGCSQPKPIVGTPLPQGDIVLTCPDCRRRWSVPAADVSDPQAPQGRYRCRDHHDQAVTPKGKGCQKCPRRKAKRPAVKKESDQ